MGGTRLCHEKRIRFERAKRRLPEHTFRFRILDVGTKVKLRHAHLYELAPKPNGQLIAVPDLTNKVGTVIYAPETPSDKFWIGSSAVEFDVDGRVYVLKFAAEELMVVP